MFYGVGGLDFGFARDAFKQLVRGTGLFKQQELSRQYFANREFQKINGQIDLSKLGARADGGHVSKWAEKSNMNRAIVNSVHTSRQGATGGDRFGAHVRQISPAIKKEAPPTILGDNGAKDRTIPHPASTYE